jgi:uncharacterized membrane protein/protein-disulfide isomerase
VLSYRYAITRVLTLAALVASAALLADYLHPNPSFCGFASNCDQVLASPFGHLLGVPLPLIGVGIFGAVFALSLDPRPWAGQLLRALAVVAGAGGAGLICLQAFVIDHLCPYCLVVDVSAMGLAAVSLAARRDTHAKTDSRARWVWLAAAVGSLGAGFILGSAGGWAGRTPVPPQIAALWVPGKVTIVEIVDFECPHCRRMHAVLTEFLGKQGDRVHFVRLTAPMPGHTHARDASRAFLCGERQGKGDVLAEALFAAASLEPATCERLGAAVGLSLGEYRACVADPETDRRLDDNVEWVRATSPRGLPVVWVQDEMLFGEQSPGTLREAVQDAEDRLARTGS